MYLFGVNSTHLTPEFFSFNKTIVNPCHIFTSTIFRDSTRTASIASCCYLCVVYELVLLNIGEHTAVTTIHCTAPTGRLTLLYTLLLQSSLRRRSRCAIPTRRREQSITPPLWTITVNYFPNRTWRHAVVIVAVRTPLTKLVN